MSKITHNPHLDDLEGSKAHHALKDQPGEQGDPNHAEMDGHLTGDLAEAVKDGDGESQIADALRAAAEPSDK